MTDHHPEHREKPEEAGSGTPGAAKAYQAAMEAAVAIPIAMGLGWFGDRHFGTEPILLIVGLGFGFATFVIRLLRMREIVESEASAAKPAEGEREAWSEEKPGGEREERFGIGDFGAGSDDEE